MEYFDGDWALLGRPEIMGEVDGGHPTPSDFFTQPVLVRQRRGEEFLEGRHAVENIGANVELGDYRGEGIPP